MSQQFQYASYASDPAKSRGRLYPEEESSGRSPFQRDRDRIIHSGAFRKLEYKTQVFVNHEGDYYRTRLTHSLEVAQLSRSLSRELGLNEDLAEALALSHDLGHPPFGHAGEDALKNAMLDFGGFDHNAQGLRILTKLEKKYAEFDGLNLTWEALEGVVKHNGPIIGSLPRAIAEYNLLQDLELSSYAGGEAQIASLSDDIAYNNHDIEDGLRAGLLSLEALLEVPLVGNVYRSLMEKYPGLERARLIHEAKRRLINFMCRDVVMVTQARIKEHNIKTVEDIRALSAPVVGFSSEMQAHCKAIKTFLNEYMYRHYKVNRMTSKARRMVSDLFGFFLAEPECLPTEWRLQAGTAHSTQTAQLVADFIAGMTDRYALHEYTRVFDYNYKLISN